jgi:hypothetical protein
MVANHKEAILQFVGCCMAALFLAGCIPEDNAQVFRSFEQSAYLQDLWADTCVFPLTEENVVMFASVRRGIFEPKFQCDWKRMPVDIGDSGVTLTEGITDLDARWFGCGSDASLPSLVWDAAKNPGSNLVHLGKGLPSDAQEAVILVAKCHYWDDHYCTIKDGNPNCYFPNADQILSMAYAVIESETGEILW